jgi:hypothetical protein
MSAIGTELKFKTINFEFEAANLWKERAASVGHIRFLLSYRAITDIMPKAELRFLQLDAFTF